LIYSTELARSVKLDYAAQVRLDFELDQPGEPVTRISPDKTLVRPDARDAEFKSLRRVPISTDLVYGLINVRTDGTHILCATMEESGTDFDVKVFRAGVDA
jgi:hypothetical protein